MTRWLKRIALAVLLIVVVAVAGGAGWEALERRRAPRDYPPTGQLVDIGGRRIHLDCRGAGSPTVVLIHGLDTGGALSWSAVHDSIAANTRTCAYSRAGIMWSDPDPRPATAKILVEDLHAVLERGGEHPPFVLVGHSFGGPLTMAFTRYYGAQIAGAVLVDIAHPDEMEKLEKVAPRIRTAGEELTRSLARFTWTGAVRLIGRAGEAMPNEPVASVRTKAAFLPTSWNGMLRESIGFNAMLQEAGEFRTFGDRPLVILTATRPFTAEERSYQQLSEEAGLEFKRIWRALHDDAMTWSTRSRHVIVPDASHYIQFDRPDLVIGAVREVVDSVRAGGAATPAAPSAAADSAIRR